MLGEAVEQARSLLSWAEHQVFNSTFLPGAVPELKRRVARLLFVLIQQTSNTPPADGAPLRRLWNLMFHWHPWNQPDIFERFLKSFGDDGEPTKETLAQLDGCEFLSTKENPYLDDATAAFFLESWDDMVPIGIAGPPAAAELFAIVREISTQGDSAAREAGDGKNPGDGGEYQCADWFSKNHGIVRARLSEAAGRDDVRTKKAPAGFHDSLGKSVRTLYHVADALKHCVPTPRKARGPGV